MGEGGGGGDTGILLNKPGNTRGLRGGNVVVMNVPNDGGKSFGGRKSNTKNTSWNNLGRGELVNGGMMLGNKGNNTTRRGFGVKGSENVKAGNNPRKGRNETVTGTMNLLDKTNINRSDQPGEELRFDLKLDGIHT